MSSNLKRHHRYAYEQMGEIAQQRRIQALVISLTPEIQVANLIFSGGCVLTLPPYSTHVTRYAASRRALCERENKERSLEMVVCRIISWSRSITQRTLHLKIIRRNYCGSLSCSKAACLTLTVHEGLGPFVKDGLPDLLPHGVCACAQDQGFTHTAIER